MKEQTYTILAAKFEEYLSSHQPYGLPDTLYAPVRYINELGGKRIRPALLLMAYHLWHEDITPALPAALAVEYFHNFSLMHDDIMDEAPLRRGKQTVHEVYGHNSAILSGDAMLIRCFDLLLEAGKKENLGAELCSMMCKASLEICEGQQMDMDFESLVSPTEAEYLEMIRKKTACLLGTSLQMGAILAGADLTTAMTLYQFGEKMGLGFQIQDDYLDVFGDSGQTGKIKGGDILRGKKNFLYVHAYNMLSAMDRKEFALDYQRAGENQDPEPILKMYEYWKIDTYTRQTQSAYITNGLEDLHSVNLEGTSGLKSLASLLMAREH